MVLQFVPNNRQISTTADKLEGILFNIYQTSVEVALAGFNKKSVYAVCSGKQHTHKGYVWKKIPKVST